MTQAEIMGTQDNQKAIEQALLRKNNARLEIL